MTDLNDLLKPVLTDTEPNVLDTLKGHIIRAATWAGYGSTANKVAGLMSAITAAVTGGRSMRLYRRNDANTADEEIVNLPSVSVGGNAATASAAQSGSALETELKRTFDAVFTANIDANIDRTPGAYGSYAFAATNTPTASGILYNFMSGATGAGDGGQFWQDLVSNKFYLRQRWGGVYSSWNAVATLDGAGRLSVPSDISTFGSITSNNDITALRNITTTGGLIGYGAGAGGSGVAVINMGQLSLVVNKPSGVLHISDHYGFTSRSNFPVYNSFVSDKDVVLVNVVNALLNGGVYGSPSLDVTVNISVKATPNNGFFNLTWKADVSSMTSVQFQFVIIKGSIT